MTSGDDDSGQRCGRTVAANGLGHEMPCTREADHAGEVHWFLGAVDQGDGTSKFGLLAVHPQSYEVTDGDRSELEAARAMKNYLLAQVEALDQEGEH